MTSKLNPATVHREFFGIPGAIGITTSLPFFTILFELLSNEKYSIKGIELDINALKSQIPNTIDGFYDLAFDKTVWAAYLSWFGILVVLDLILPGKRTEGIQLRDNTKLGYKINGLSMSGCLLTLLAARLFSAENYFLPELDFLYNNQLKLILTTIFFSFLLAFFVYAISYIPLRKPNGLGTHERILSINGNTGNILYDWFIGRELNPRIGSWDIKLFCELKPGMLLWFLINLSCIHHQYHELGTVSDSLILVNLLQAFYIFDGVLNEEGCLSMIDITTDGFGFMLSFGDLAWLPWTYSLQSRYLSLADNYLELGYGKVAAIVLVKAIGYYIFHSANKQKSDFRMGRLDNLKLTSIQTKTGSKLLCDGWWGISQHINYFGDWLIGWSWCLPTGFQTPLTYFYVIYFGILLVHRQERDDAKCRAKYGAQWEEYEKRVPYKIIPFVY